MFRNALALFLAAAALATGADWIWSEWQFAQQRTIGSAIDRGGAGLEQEVIWETPSREILPFTRRVGLCLLDGRVYLSVPGASFDLAQLHFRRDPPTGLSLFHREKWFNVSAAAPRAVPGWVDVISVPDWLILALAAPYPAIRFLRARIHRRRCLSARPRASLARVTFRWTLGALFAVCALVSAAALSRVGVGDPQPLSLYSMSFLSSTLLDEPPDTHELLDEGLGLGSARDIGGDFVLGSTIRPSPSEHAVYALWRGVRIAFPLGSAGVMTTPSFPDAVLACWGAEYSWARTATGRRLHVFTIPYWLILVATAPYPLYLVVADPLRRRRRRRRGLCPMCGYDLRGSPSGVCSECGWGGAMSPDSR